MTINKFITVLLLMLISVLTPCCILEKTNYDPPFGGNIEPAEEFTIKGVNSDIITFNMVSSQLDLQEKYLNDNDYLGLLVYAGETVVDGDIVYDNNRAYLGIRIKTSPSEGIDISGRYVLSQTSATDKADFAFLSVMVDDIRYNNLEGYIDLVYESSVLSGNYSCTVVDENDETKSYEISGVFNVNLSVFHCFTCDNNTEVGDCHSWTEIIALENNEFCQQYL